MDAGQRVHQPMEQAVEITDGAMRANALKSVQGQVPLMANGENGVRGLGVHGLAAVVFLSLNASVTIPDPKTMDGTVLGSVGDIECAIQSLVTKPH
jgi:hypothetical protein